MWLLEISNYRLRQFFGHVWMDHPYAILSHTWGEDEVSFQDMQNVEAARHKAGFRKIENTCKQAKLDGLAFAWVDTCCINKESSSELQEAINSMFEWYAQAERCYAFLVDVHGPTIVESRWFTRGWTLQELIAPHDVDFYDTEWKHLGTRSSYEHSIAERTGIDPSLLTAGAIGKGQHSKRRLEDYSIAQRMSWASHRDTARVEDRAYCLLGVFGVSMPMLYGEGQRSFIRLQEEILRTSIDLSIFLWNLPRGISYDESHESFSQTIFAPSPRAFEKCGDILFDAAHWNFESAMDRTTSVVGIKVKLPIIPIEIDDYDPADFAAPLSCHRISNITSITALKLISQRHEEVSMPGSSNDDSEILYMMPYSKAYMTMFDVTERTVEVDIFQAETEKGHALRTVVLLQQQTDIFTQQMSKRRRERQLLRTEVPRQLPQLGSQTSWYSSIWLRFSSVTRLGPQWHATQCYPKSEWAQNPLILDASQEQSTSRVITGSVSCLLGAIVLRKHDVLDSRVLITFCLRSMNASRGPVLAMKVKSVQAGDFETEKDLREAADALLDSRRSSTFGMHARSVKLYEGTFTYDAAIFAIKPESRTLSRKLVLVLHAFDLTDSKQLDEIDNETSRMPIAHRIR